ELGKSEVLKEVVSYAEPTAAHLYDAARKGDPACEAEIRNGGHILGLALGSLANVLNPDAITLSGGLLAMGEMLLEPMRAAMRSMVYGAAGAANVRLSELGENAGLLGAAAVALEYLEGS
ncbi:ROK family protein, partial [Tepidiforma sp.]|uniref:ROK family protein n=1 Tax=Tepidiforma sp. TaxID=2682230 RepID=UPI002ADD349E